MNNTAKQLASARAIYSRAIYSGASLEGFTKLELVEALQNSALHFLPPRPSRQSAKTIRAAARDAMNSMSHGSRFKDALRIIRRHAMEKEQCR